MNEEGNGRIKVFTAKDIKELGLEALSPLTVTSLNELISLLPRYYNLFEPIFEEVTAEGYISRRKLLTLRKNQETKEGIGTFGGGMFRTKIPNVVKFGSCDDGYYVHLHYFDGIGWLEYVAKSNQQSQESLDDIDAKEVARVMRDRVYGPYTLEVAHSRSDICKFIAENRKKYSPEELEKEYNKVADQRLEGWDYIRERKERIFSSLEQAVEYVRMAATLRISR